MSNDSHTLVCTIRQHGVCHTLVVQPVTAVGDGGLHPRRPKPVLHFVGQPPPLPGVTPCSFLYVILCPPVVVERQICRRQPNPDLAKKRLLGLAVNSTQQAGHAFFRVVAIHLGQQLPYPKLRLLLSGKRHHHSQRVIPCRPGGKHELAAEVAGVHHVGKVFGQLLYLRQEGAYAANVSLAQQRLGISYVGLFGQRHGFLSVFQSILLEVVGLQVVKVPPLNEIGQALPLAKAQARLQQAGISFRRSKGVLADKAKQAVQLMQ